MDIHEKIRHQVSSNRIVLYMKGTPQFPQCGFSSVAVEILKRCGVSDMLTVDVLQDPDIRQGIKEFSDWPTIPQLFVDREFIGGADIMRELFHSGDMQNILNADPGAGQSEDAAQ